MIHQSGSRSANGFSCPFMSLAATFGTGETDGVRADRAPATRRRVVAL